MSENRRKLLIKAGMKLFSEKGYHKTSIQEIATKAKISKGAFYLYFQSKERFVAKALQFFYEEITKKVANVSMRDYSSHESLAKQINVLVAYLYEHRYIIIMHLQTDISLGEHAMKLFQKIRVDNFQWLKENITAIYGSQLNDYLLDVIVQFEGMINGVFQWLIIDEIPVEKEKIGPYLVRRLDEMVQAMIKSEETPLLLMEDLPRQYRTNVHHYTVEEKLNDILVSMHQKISKMDLPSQKQHELHEVVDTVLQKIKEKDQQNIVMQGLLAHFNHIPRLQDECEEISQLLQIELLD